MIMPLKSERYIGAERLKGVVNVRSSHWLNDWDTPKVLAVIDEQPTADVAPVIHAHWETIFDELGNYGFEKCSACGDKYGSFTYRYCPNCGAKMDEVTDDGKE